MILVKMAIYNLELSQKKIYMNFEDHLFKKKLKGRED
jgi:hypothetical protein